MAIADKLTYINTTKTLLRQAINDAGGSISADTPFRQYADWIRDQGATLWLDFVNQNYYSKGAATHYPAGVGFDLITFTRSTGGGRFNAQGQYEWLPANEPRIDYDPVTGECRGLLIEESRTNLLTHSSDFANAAWAKISVHISANTTTAPDGEMDADMVIPISGATYTHIRNYGIPSSSGALTFSVFCKSGGWSHIYLSLVNSSFIGVAFDLIEKTATLVGSAGQVGSVEDFGGGWLRCSITQVLTNQTAYGFIQVRPNGSAGGAGDGVSGIYIWGAQLEEGSFPTSYIPTEGAQVTRAADIAMVNDLAPWYNPNQGSFSIKAKGHIGEPLLAAGDALIIADSDELKEYQVSYSEDLQATQVDMGKGLIESVQYWPRETA